MKKPFLVLPLFLAACGNDSTACALNDVDCDGVPDDLGYVVDIDGHAGPDLVDTDGDGTADGYLIDTTGDGQADAVGYDTTGDGFIDSLDSDMDGEIDRATGDGLPVGSSGTTTGATTGTTTGATTGTTTGATTGTTTGATTGTTTGATTGTTTGATTGTTTGATTGTTTGAATGTTTGTTTGGSGANCLTDGGAHLVSGSVNGGDVSSRYAKSDVKRGDTFYKFIANGWGPGFQSHNISWAGTTMSVNSFSGSQGANYEPAGYPTVLLGNYTAPGEEAYPNISNNSPFPRAISAISELNTGVSWSHNGNEQYNVAYDVWLSNGAGLTSYFMVWLRDPPQHRPAGDKREQGISVPGVDGVWDIWAGYVNGRKIINYVRPEGTNTKELSFDMMTFLNDAKGRNYDLGGTHINAVAIGFEIWNGPVSNLKLNDFCVDVR